MDGVLEDHGAAALRAKMLHRTAEDDGLVLAVPDLAACEDRVEEGLNAAAAQRRVDGDLRLVRIHAVEIQLHHAAHHIEHLRTFVAFMIPQRR